MNNPQWNWGYQIHYLLTPAEFPIVTSYIYFGIKKLYPDATIGQVTYFEDNDENVTDMIEYGIQFESKTKYFIELTQGANKFVVMSDKDGDISLFKQL